jgi:hypothetical protein
MDNAKRGIDVISGVNEALKFKKENPRASEEKIMNHIMVFLRDKQFRETRLDVIVGVAHALKIVEKENLKDREVIDRVVRELDSILPKEE